MAPLCGDAPYGVSLRFDADFELLRAEINKLENIDDTLVQERALSIIECKSKDVRALVFLLFSYMRTERWEMAAQVIEGLVQLVQDGYEKLFPDRPAARTNALGWLAEQRVSDTLATKKPTTADYAALVRLRTALEQLQSALAMIGTQPNPFPTVLLDTIKRFELSCRPTLPSNLPPPPTEKALLTDPCASPLHPPITLSSVNAASPAHPGTPEQAKHRLRSAALVIIREQPDKPLGYRLLRTLRWEVVEQLPPHLDTLTQLPAPSGQLRSVLDTLFSQQRWTEVLAQTESAYASSSNHLWLDLQYMAAQSAHELGAGYWLVHEALCAETARLIRRIPELPILHFDDGTAIADETTRQWLQTLLPLSSLPPPQPAVLMPTVSAGTAGEKRPHRADTVLTHNQEMEAVALLQQTLHATSHPRERFCQSLHIGTVLLRAKKTDIALGLLEALETTLEQHQLQRWEPELCGDLWTTLYQAYTAAGSSKTLSPQVVTQKHHQILGKLSQLDPLRACTLHP